MIWFFLGLSMLVVRADIVSATAEVFLFMWLIVDAATSSGQRKRETKVAVAWSFAFVTWNIVSTLIRSEFQLVVLIEAVKAALLVAIPMLLIHSNNSQKIVKHIVVFFLGVSIASFLAALLKIAPLVPAAMPLPTDTYYTKVISLYAGTILLGALYIKISNTERWSGQIAHRERSSLLYKMSLGLFFASIYSAYIASYKSSILSAFLLLAPFIFSLSMKTIKKCSTILIFSALLLSVLQLVVFHSFETIVDIYGLTQLENKSFVDRAPKDVVDGAKTRLADTLSDIATYQEQLGSISKLLP